jgi:hypothetical protein
MERIERQRSARLDRERLALERLVTAEFELRQGEDEVNDDVAGAAGAKHQLQRRGSSVYLPVTHDRTRDNLRVAKRVLQVESQHAGRSGEAGNESLTLCGCCGRPCSRYTGATTAST